MLHVKGVKSVSMIKNEFNTVSVWGYTIFSDSLSKIPVHAEKCRSVNCSISPNGYGLALKDPEFNRILKNTDFLVLDGVFFALASMFLQGKNIRKNQGPDVYKHFITRMNDTSGKVFFLGSSNTVLQKIKERLSRDYPNVTAASFSPPFKPEFSQEENREMIAAINAFKPDIVFIGMTAPKQDKWSFKHKHELNAGLIINIGNVFDWYAGTQKEIHPFFYKIRLAWLVRIFLRPEVFKRNIGNQLVFLWHLTLMVLRLKKQPGL